MSEEATYGPESLENESVCVPKMADVNNSENAVDRMKNNVSSVAVNNAANSNGMVVSADECETLNEIMQGHPDVGHTHTQNDHLSAENNKAAGVEDVDSNMTDIKGMSVPEDKPVNGERRAEKFSQSNNFNNAENVFENELSAEKFGSADDENNVDKKNAHELDVDCSGQGEQGVMLQESIDLASEKAIEGSCEELPEYVENAVKKIPGNNSEDIEQKKLCNNSALDKQCSEVRELSVLQEATDLAKTQDDKSSSMLNATTEDSGEEDGVMDFLGKSNNQAEARLAARRQARAEAREIRMRELERQQKEIEENADKVYDMYTDPTSRTARVAATVASGRLSAGAGGSGGSYTSSRRSSEDSLEEGINLRDVRLELKEVEEKFRKAMVQNAQLDNEKASLTYQVELLKDRLEDLEEQHAQLQREHREKCREHDQLKRATAKLKEEVDWFRTQLEERDLLIKEAGMTIVGDDQVSSEEDSGGEGSGSPSRQQPSKPRRALVSIESAELLGTAGEGSLDVRLRRIAEERNELLDEVRHLKLELEESRSRQHKVSGLNAGLTVNSVASLNGPDTAGIAADLQREANKQLGDYKFKLQKAEQDVSTLQANVARLESQVIRYKAASESAEKVEDELKVEKRKLQRELREAQARVEELETSNTHLQRRLDKLKSAKSALLKEL